MLSRTQLARSAFFLCLWQSESGNAYFPNMSLIRHHQHVLVTSLKCVPSQLRTQSIRAVSSRRLSHRSSIDSCPIANVAIIGGGLAGLSTAYHLLELTGNNKDKFPSGIHITIFDKALVGEGGASSVAGGLMHPFSPRGKLIHFGLPALDQSNHLLQMASKNQPQCILRPHLYRIALKPNSDVQLQDTAGKFPNFARWMTKEEIHSKFDIDSSGGLQLGGGCKVIHVPSYLKGLLEACETKASALSGTFEWKLVHEIDKHQQQKNVEEPSLIAWNDIDSMNQHLAQFDAVILSAGAGIVHDKLVSEEVDLPAQLVRGQTIEMILPSADDSGMQHEAFLCGKYVSPLPINPADGLSQRYIIGATHEFKDTPLSEKEVVDELKRQTYELAPHLWDNGTTSRLTTGVRLQSRRGSFGRMPMIGRYTADNGGIRHHNSWIFTGLSSRGLIYHGLFGQWLANAVLHNNEEELRERFDDFDWWKTGS